MRYFVIRLTRTEDSPIVSSPYFNPEYHYSSVAGYCWYHHAGRGNGAVANMYEEKQVNRILGKYGGEKGVKAEAVEVVFKEGS